MRPQCVRASIAAGYRGLYTTLMDTGAETPSDDINHISLLVDAFVLKDAGASWERDFYMADLQRRQRERGVKPLKRSYGKWRTVSPGKWGY
ncbi:hypothetical protein J3458_019669 [Metarhizium acridum]|nr:hypothetical protein J3458_019669 [Metarhizium acridum]